MDADRLDPPFPWIGKTVFERWGMREDEGETLKTVQRIMAGQWDPWKRLAVGILAQYWEGLYRALCKKYMHGRQRTEWGGCWQHHPKQHPSVECP